MQFKYSLPQDSLSLYTTALLRGFLNCIYMGKNSWQKPNANAVKSHAKIYIKKYCFDKMQKHLRNWHVIPTPFGETRLLNQS